MTKRLNGKVAIITGAASGMGAEHARTFVAEGAKVALADLAVEAGEKLAKELGDSALFVQLDVADPESWAGAVATVVGTFGPVSVLVNNAGLTGPSADVADMSREDYLKVISVDQHGTFFGMQAVLPGMVENGGGSIINISSISGMAHTAGTPNAAYTTAKFAVRGMTKAAAVQYGPRGVRVNTVHPGPIVTPLMFSSASQEVIDQAAASLPLRRLGQPRDVSNLVVFLASDDSSFITAEEHVIDGGLLAE